MTINQRIYWCRTLAQDADDDRLDGYIAELAGLMGLPLAASLEAYKTRYALGARDRATLLLIDDPGPNTAALDANN